jgi:hypothetical protein
MWYVKAIDRFLEIIDPVVEVLEEVNYERLFVRVVFALTVLGGVYVYLVDFLLAPPRDAPPVVDPEVAVRLAPIGQVAIAESAMTPVEAVSAVAPDAPSETAPEAMVAEPIAAESLSGADSMEVGSAAAVDDSSDQGRAISDDGASPSEPDAIAELPPEVASVPSGDLAPAVAVGERTSQEQSEVEAAVVGSSSAAVADVLGDSPLRSDVVSMPGEPESGASATPPVESAPVDDVAGPGAMPPGASPVVTAPTAPGYAPMAPGFMPMPGYPPAYPGYGVPQPPAPVTAPMPQQAPSTVAQPAASQTPAAPGWYGQYPPRYAPQYPPQQVPYGYPRPGVPGYAPGVQSAPGWPR